MVLDIDIDASSARRALSKLEGSIPNNRDDIARELAEEGRNRMVRELQRQGSVTTGTSVRNLRVKRQGFGSYSIVGPKYLRYVDQGTKPHYPPYQSNKRFRDWAITHGMRPRALAESIALKGTQPHPFIARSLLPIIRGADDKALDKLDESVDKA